ncbi:hypothetical protein AAFC00_003232 [Neodothiora populina]|uniref:Polyketide cyclase/dehydrase n=1 Tax=Neodothiora populina TaxID=2781224 RepID=A0ABR3P9S8_9PEZI
MADSDLIAITTADELPRSPVEASTSTHARPTPTIPHGGLFSPYSAIQIDAPPQAVYDAIVDAASWKQWNSFVPSATIKPPSGSTDTSNMTLNASMTFKVNMTYGTTTVSKEHVNILDPPPNTVQSQTGHITRICWVLDNKAIITPRFLMHAERVNEIEDRGDGTTIYRTWETFGGPLARFVKWKYEAMLKDRFKDWARDLKMYVERKEAVNKERGTAIEMPA